MNDYITTLFKLGDIYLALIHKHVFFIFCCLVLKLKKKKQKTTKKIAFKRPLGQSRLSVQVRVFIIRIISFKTDDGIDYLLVPVTLKRFGFVLNKKKIK